MAKVKTKAKTKESKVKKDRPMLIREAKVTDFLRTGSTQLDMAISCHKSDHGGIPTRRITEMSGTGASGKTFICGELTGDAIRKGYSVYVDDIERRWDLKRLNTFGFEEGDKNFHYISPSSSVEKCFEKMFKTLDKVKKGDKLLYIVDPIAALYAEQELKSDKMSQARAKALQKNMRFLKDRVSTDSDASIAVVFSNQLIDAVGQTFGPDKITPGGNAMIHWPSVRIRFSLQGKIKTKKLGRNEEFDKYDGIKLHAEITKNSEDDPFRVADFTIQFGYGIDDIHDNANWLKRHTEILGTQDGWFKFPKFKGKAAHKNIRGIKAFVHYIEWKNLEKQLASLTRKYYRLWHEPHSRKPKVRT